MTSSKTYYDFGIYFEVKKIAKRNRLPIATVKTSRFKRASFIKRLSFFVPTN